MDCFRYKGEGVVKRTPMKRKPPPDPVPTVVRAEVYARDRVCFLYRLDSGHQCRNAYGNPHAPGDLAQMTVDHVKDALMFGRRAPSDRRHLVTMCYAGNVAVPSKAIRQAEREYLDAMYGDEPDHAACVDPCSSVCPAGRVA